MSKAIEPAGLDQVVASIDQQVAWARTLGSPFTANMLEVIRENLETGGALARVALPWRGEPVVDVLPLRLTGALQMLARTGRAHELARYYPKGGKTWDTNDVAREVERAVSANADFVRSILARPPQTNEIGRSAILMPAYSVLARQFNLPLRILEVGASAGLNLMWDRFRYELGEHNVGDASSPVTVRAGWSGSWPGIDRLPTVKERRGCDRTSIDLAAPGEADRLMSYMWPDQTERVTRLEGAIALAQQVRPVVEQADAGEWLERMLATPIPGVVTVIAHSIVWQYFSAETSARGRRAISDAGARATPEAPQAWVAFEHEDTARPPSLKITTWPGGETRTLAHAHPHGTTVHWLGE